jgi:hypothetical protein
VLAGPSVIALSDRLRHFSGFCPIVHSRLSQQFCFAIMGSVRPPSPPSRSFMALHNLSSTRT